MTGHRKNKLNLHLPVLFILLIALVVLLFRLPVHYCSKTDKSKNFENKLQADNIFQKLNSSCKEVSIERDLPFLKDGECVIIKTSLEVKRKCDPYFPENCHACIQSGTIIEQLQWNRSNRLPEPKNSELYNFDQVWSEKTIRWPAEYRAIYDNFRNKPFSWKSKMQNNNFSEVTLGRGKLFLDSKIRSFICEVDSNFIDFREYTYPTTYHSWFYFKQKDGEKIDKGKFDNSISTVSNRSDLEIGTYRMKYYCNGLADSTVTVLGEFKKSTHSIGLFEGKYFHFEKSRLNKKEIIDRYIESRKNGDNQNRPFCDLEFYWYLVMSLLVLFVAVLLLRFVSKPDKKLLKDTKDQNKENRLDTSFQGEYQCQSYYV